ncbi:MAG: hypothetical protein V1870_05140 [Candidatus Aenigmatarchaeota archaeon]
MSENSKFMKAMKSIGFSSGDERCLRYGLVNAIIEGTYPGEKDGIYYMPVSIIVPKNVSVVVDEKTGFYYDLCGKLSMKGEFKEMKKTNDYVEIKLVKLSGDVFEYRDNKLRQIKYRHIDRVRSVFINDDRLFIKNTILNTGIVYAYYMEEIWDNIVHGFHGMAGYVRMDWHRQISKNAKPGDFFR